MTNSTKIALGLFGAAAAGLLAGILIAPEKGKDLRKKIKNKTSDLTDHLSDLFVNKGNNIKSSVESPASRFQENVN